MISWRPVLVFAGVSVGTTAAIAVLCAVMGWTVQSWALLAPLAMWAPALGRFVARSTVDRNFTGTLPVRRWGAGCVDAGGLFSSLALFAIAGLPVSFLFARESYLARSVWPAVFFHSFHNTISQWLFPRLFAGGDNELWLGETGLLPVAGYVVFGAAVFIWMKWRGQSWQALARSAGKPEVESQ